MNIHEYQAKQILKFYGAPVPNGFVVFNTDGLGDKIKRLNSKKFVVKAQIHAGGRGRETERRARACSGPDHRVGGLARGPLRRGPRILSRKAQAANGSDPGGDGSAGFSPIAPGSRDPDRSPRHPGRTRSSSQSRGPVPECGRGLRCGPGRGSTPGFPASGDGPGGQYNRFQGQ